MNITKPFSLGEYCYGFTTQGPNHQTIFEVKPWYFPPAGKMFLKMIQPGDFYYDRKKGKKNGKEMMPLEQPTSLRMEPLIPIKYDARIHSGGKFQRVLITRRSRRVPMDCKLLVVVWLQMPINFFHHISFGQKSFRNIIHSQGEEIGFT